MITVLIPSFVFLRMSISQLKGHVEVEQENKQSLCP